MALIDKELVEFIFDYVGKYKWYEDKEELSIAGLLTREEEHIQIKFEEFVLIF
ncbi:hypothetical protein [Clostridium septicum]|uniref:hypothetical protein n=1 Tax=Clostridium septicum TaxID=1504 RepID=UPI001FAAA4E2|nr:hypothetical protein [Clostridium septicum]